MEEYIRILPKAAFAINSRYFFFAGMAFLLLYVIFKTKFSPFKIQKKYPANKDYLRELLFSLLSMTIFTAVATSVFTILKPYTQLYKNISDYGWWYYGFSIVMMMFIHDTYFYWLHRAMHHPLLYRSVHLVHHQSTNPSPWTAYAFHPLEAICEAAIIVIIAMVMPAHHTAIILFFLFQIIYNVYGHSGFEFYPKNIIKHPIGKWLNTSVSHNQHHHYFNGNYGLYFLFWDRLMGTMREDYEKEFEEAKDSGQRTVENGQQIMDNG